MGSPLERKLLDLRQQYLPFLQRTMGYLAQKRDTAECQKINGLIEVALNLDNLHQYGHTFPQPLLYQLKRVLLDKY